MVGLCDSTATFLLVLKFMLFSDPGETAEIPYVSATPDLLFPHSPTVVQPLDPQLNSDPVDVEGANMPIESDGGFPMENNKGDSDQGGNIQDKISPNEISKENQDDRQDLSFNGNDKSEVIPLTSSPKGNNKGDTGDDEQESTPGIGLIEATEVDVEAPASVETPRQQNMLSHAADKPEPASSEEEPLLSADVGTPPQQNIPPATDQLKLPVPLDPVITNGNLLTTTSVLPKRTQSVDQILFGVSSEVPSVSLSISSTESINDSPSSDKSSAVSEDGNPVNPEKQSEKSNAENNDDDAEDGNTPESFDNNAETSSNLTSDETKKTEKVASPSDTISQSIQTKSTLTTTEASSNSKSSTSMAAENAEEPDATITSELTETIQPDDHIDYPTPAETDEPLATQKPQSTLLTSNNPPKELAKPSKSTNDSIQVTTSSSSLQLTPSASLVQSHPQLNQSGIAVANNNEDDVKTTPSLKSLATTLTLTNNLPATIHASTSPPILSSSTTTTVKTTLYKTSSAKSTHVAMPEHADRSKTSPSTTSSTTLSTTTATSTKQAVSPAESSSKTPVIPDEEAEHNRYVSLLFVCLLFSL